MANELEDRLDPYSPMVHKAGLDPQRRGRWSPPSWLPVSAERRLIAYRILDAYMHNMGRFTAGYQGDTIEDQQRFERAIREQREYGDPRLLVNRLVAGVVGTNPAVRVVGSSEPPPLRPELPEAPVEPDGDDPIENRIYERLKAIYEADLDEQLALWEQRWQQWPIVSGLQRWCEAWQHAVGYAAKIYELEATGAVPLGDGVAVMSYDPEAKLAKLTVYEPDAYHPVLDPNADPGEYPTKVHIAFEWVEPDESGKNGDKTYLRRITYELVDLDDPTRQGDPNPVPVEWSDEPRTQTCLLTDKTWDLGVEASTVRWPNLDEEAGTPATVTVDGVEVEVVDLDLQIDWIPVLHVPNTPATQWHFGRSSLANVLHIIDSLIAADTDLERAAALAGVPMVAVETTGTAPDVKIRPGQVITGKVTAVDLSASVNVLLELAAHLLERLSVNSEVTTTVLGRVDAKVIPSGVALALMRAPFDTLVAVMRLTRTVKHPLLPKWALRWAQVHGHGPEIPGWDGSTPDFETMFPDNRVPDLAAVVEWVVSLIEAHGISKATALKILQENGVPVANLAAELDSIAADDTAAAKDIADATASEELAARRLGLTIPTPDNEPPDLGDSDPNATPPAIF